jgi:hypothetical protein
LALTKQDLEAFAARIRPHFKPELRDIAYELALGIARCVGPKAKELRPDTRFEEIFEWFEKPEPFPTSLDQVEWVMALEEELGMALPDSMAGQPKFGTFRELVLERARKRHAA